MIRLPPRLADLEMGSMPSTKALMTGGDGLFREETPEAGHADIALLRDSTPAAIGATSTDGCLQRITILIVGVVIGFTFLLPNAMMSDPGTPRATRAANIGLIACLAFGIGGVVGAILNTWKALLPGLVLQVLAFVVLG
jgi:hypothetical protein